MSPWVVLVGPPGAGKTTVGELLAERTGRVFRDTDRDVESAAGRSISDIFVDEGEAEFRRLEQAAVRTALAEHDGVLALGGGAVLNTETRALLQRHTVAFLDVDLVSAADRVGLNRSRPLLLGNPRAQLARMLDERRPLYTEVATVVVETSGLRPADACDAVLAALVTA